VIGTVDETWRRIAGLHVTAAGDIAVVWLAHDKDADTIHLYNCAMFRNQPPAIITEGIAALGRWIPIAWEAKSKPTHDMLLDRGLNMIEALKEDDASSEINSREIWERMRTGRFKVSNRLREWLDEYKTFYRTDTTVPRDSHPMMAATRYAVAQLDWAKRLRPKGKKQTNHPRIAMI
jgi:hypothetical protein